MITLLNESEFSNFISDEDNQDLQSVIDWINKNLDPKDVFDTEKLQQYESDKQS